MPEPIINIDETINFFRKIKDKLPCGVDGKEVDNRKLCTIFHCPLALYLETESMMGFRVKQDIHLCRLLNTARKIWENLRER